MSTGLFFIPSKPLEVHPNHPASTGTYDFVKTHKRELLLYETSQSHRQIPPAPPGVALALFSDYASIKQRMATVKLPAVPAVNAECCVLEEALYAQDCAKDAAKDEINGIESESFELPPPKRMDDDLTMSNNVEDAIHDDDNDYSFLDALDYQNALPDYDPDQDSSEFYIDNAHAWIEVDKKECIGGARGRLYEGFDVGKDTSENEYLQSEVWDPKPLGGESELARYLFITQIPSKPPSADTNPSAPPKMDEDFLRMFHRYGYLTSNDSLRRISCFRQDDPEFPRWLLVQEFADCGRYNYALKKREAEYWWRKNGWEGCIMEFFRLKEKRPETSRPDGGKIGAS